MIQGSRYIFWFDEVRYGWAISLLDISLMEFNKSIVQYPNKKRFPGGASNDMIPNLQNAANPLPYDPIKLPKTVGAH